jgi:hypothetical protein
MNPNLCICYPVSEQTIKGKGWPRRFFFAKFPRMEYFQSSKFHRFWASKHLNRFTILKPLKRSVMDLCPPYLPWAVELYPPTQMPSSHSEISFVNDTCFGLVCIGQKGLKDSLAGGRHWAAPHAAVSSIHGTSPCGMTVVFGISKVCSVFCIIWILNDRDRKLLFCRHSPRKYTWFINPLCPNTGVHEFSNNLGAI